MSQQATGIDLGGGGVIDTRGIAKAPYHDGQDETWDAFCFKFEAYTSLLGWADGMEAAVNHPTPIDITTLNDRAKGTSLQLQAVLISLCS